MTESSSERVTNYLERLRAGSGTAAHRLAPLVYDELHRIADGLFRDQRAGHTLQPTSLVHEAYLRLVKDGRRYDSRQHFYRVAAKAMRRLLMDYARDRRRQKRGGGRELVALTPDVPDESSELQLDLVALDEALTELAQLSERQARVVELRFLAGLTTAETAHALGVTERTVYHDWRLARIWLEDRLVPSD